MLINPYKTHPISTKQHPSPTLLRKKEIHFSANSDKKKNRSNKTRSFLSNFANNVKEYSKSLLKKLMDSALHTVSIAFLPIHMLQPLHSVLSTLIIEPFNLFIKAYKMAKYQKTGDLTVFKKELPHRYAIRHDKKQLKTYNAAVKKVAQKLQILESPFNRGRVSRLIQKNGGNDNSSPFWMSSPNEVDIHSLNLNLKPMSKERQTLIASAIVDLFIHQPDIINRILQREKPLNVVTCTGGLNNSSDACYFDYANTILLGGIEFYPMAIQHEFIHAATVFEKNCTPTLPEFTEQQSEVFEECMESLTNQYKKNDHNWVGRFKAWLGLTSSTGLKAYSFFDPREFITTTINHFVYSPEKLQKNDAGKKLYGLYKDFFKIDPLSWKAA